MTIDRPPPPPPPPPPAWVVVPCYNEAKRLQPSAFLEFLCTPVHVHFVNDGSSDATAAVLATLCEGSQGQFSFENLEHNLGKAEAVRHGLLHALNQGAVSVGFLDADLSTPPSEMLRLLAHLQANPQLQVLLGARIRLLGHQVQRSPLRHYLGRVFATAASLTLAKPIYDTQCGAKWFAAGPGLRAALSEPFESRWIFDVELLARLLHGWQGQDALAGDAIAELPLQQWRDVAGSKLSAAAMARAALDLARIAQRLRRS